MISPTPPVHPGEILREEFLTPLNLTPYAVAKACNVPRPRIERLVREKTPITADTALRLGRFFNTGPEFWCTLQTMYDLAMAGMAAPDIDGIKPKDAA
ncbi:MAG: plasmid maintenance system antidote protein [Rhodospirillaceae bacterium]|nr:MAG: plasmid maintenance system antidote protein [Rhodospirillaceae bacterium]